MRDLSAADGPTELVPLHITDEGDPTATLTLHLAGDLDCCTAQQFCNTVEQRLTGHPKILCVDLGKVAFLDAAGCQALLHCHAEAAQQCCQLLLIRPQPLVHQVLDILGLLTTFGLPPPPIPAWRRRDTRPPSAPQPFTPPRRPSRRHAPLSPQPMTPNVAPRPSASTPTACSVPTRSD